MNSVLHYRDITRNGEDWNAPIITITHSFQFLML